MIDTETLDLADVIALLEAALREAHKLDGEPAVLDREVAKNRPLAAAINRRLQVLQHYAERAATETSALLWTLKGFPDPLREDT